MAGHCASLVFVLDCQISRCCFNVLLDEQSVFVLRLPISAGYQDWTWLGYECWEGHSIHPNLCLDVSEPSKERSPLAEQRLLLGLQFGPLVHLGVLFDAAHLQRGS